MWPKSGVGARCGRPCRRPSTGWRLDGPVDHVDVVDVLLDDVVAAEPGEVVPVAHLVLQVGPSRLRDRAARGCPGSSSSWPPTISPIAPSWMRFIVSDVRAGGGAACRPRCPGSSWSTSSCGSSTLRMPAPSTATGFSVKMCLPASTAASMCSGAEAGRRGQDDVVDVGLRAPSCRASRPTKQWSRLTRCLVAGPAFAQAPRQLVDRSRKASARATILTPLARCRHVLGGAGAAAAAADQADLDLVRAGGVDADQPLEASHGGGAHGSRGGVPDEIAA